MATDAAPHRYRRLRKASDLSSGTTASLPSKRMRAGDKYTSHDDRISSLPDELLISIIDKLDMRTTITTIILSKRWRNLPRPTFTSYNLAVDDMLPPRYHRLKCHNMEAKAAYEAEKNANELTCIYAIKARHERWMMTIRPLTAILERYERRAMRRYVRQGGVEDFELVVNGDCVSYDLGLLDGYRDLRLRRLVLSNCQVVPIWNSSTLQGLTKLSLGEGSYMGLVNDILRNCTQLTDFRISNSIYYQSSFPIAVPSSKLKNLQVDRCSFGKIFLTSLPCLETFYCRDRPTKLYYGDVPRLRHVSLDYSQTKDDDKDERSGSNRVYSPSMFFSMVPPLDCLVLQFKEPQIWIAPLAVPAPFNHLKKLFVANVPVNWDTFWIFLLLDAAPALESFHVHFDTSTEVQSTDVVWSSLDADGQQQHQYRRLKELIMAGFDGVGWQTSFIRLIMKKSPLLRCIHLLDRQIVDDGQELGGLQIIPRRRKWHECERSKVIEDLTAGIHWPPEIILE